MAHYTDLSRGEIETIAGTLADILLSLGYDAMADDCRGKRIDGDLPRYAATTVKLVRRCNPDKATALASVLRRVGLA